MAGSTLNSHVVKKKRPGSLIKISSPEKINTKSSEGLMILYLLNRGVVWVWLPCAVAKNLPHL